MATAKEIKTRLSSVRETEKITNAMYLIASSKMQRARRMMRAAEPYMDFVRSEIENIFKYAPEADSHYFAREDQGESSALLVITADKGLCGSYNTAILRAADRLLAEHTDTLSYVVGDFGRRHFQKQGYNYEKSFETASRFPDMREAREIAAELIELYDSGAAVQVNVLYSHVSKGLGSEPAFMRILPFERADFDNAEAATGYERDKYEFVPSAGAALDNALRSLATGSIYGALTESFCAEQNARVLAMRAACDNADKLIDELSLSYNRLRQNSITNEITEISSGEMAIKRKKKKAKETIV